MPAHNIFQIIFAYSKAFQVHVAHSCINLRTGNFDNEKPGTSRIPYPSFSFYSQFNWIELLSSFLIRSFFYFSYIYLHIYIHFFQRGHILLSHSIPSSIRLKSYLLFKSIPSFLIYIQPKCATRYSNHFITACDSPPT